MTTGMDRMVELSRCIRLNDQEKEDLLLLLEVVRCAKNAIDLHPELEGVSWARLRAVCSKLTAGERSPMRWLRRMRET